MDVNQLHYLNTCAQIINAGAMLLSLCVASAAIARHRSVACKALTATFLYESRFDKRYIEGLHTLRAIHLSGRSFRSYIFSSATFNQSEKDERQQLVYCLNFYERLAVGILHGIYHEKMIKEVFYNSIINNYVIAEPFINAIREKEKRGTYYQEYEYLVRRWRKAPLLARFS
ncbi:DUF4760 domain-containing protein [Enterobacteriaceae bacterium 89]|nr:DUF4760 domain-containing protein [Enterobacteriaceae bacterium 89]